MHVESQLSQSMNFEQSNKSPKFASNKEDDFYDTNTLLEMNRREQKLEGLRHPIIPYKHFLGIVKKMKNVKSNEFKNKDVQNTKPSEKINLIINEEANNPDKKDQETVKDKKKDEKKDDKKDVKNDKEIDKKKDKKDLTKVPDKTIVKKDVKEKREVKEEIVKMTKEEMDAKIKQNA